VRKIWSKDYELNELIEDFTVGQDYLLDARLVPADCAASAAHARMLSAIGILSRQELKDILQGLGEILELHKKGDFQISKSQEDCHTAIEAYLTARYGDAGKKIHTGRSRNDQVLAALRLFSKGWLHAFGELLGEVVRTLFDFGENYSQVPMPGRTHTQIAMPSSVGLWAASFGEEMLDLFRLLLAAYDLNDQCPLGSAAGYGVPLPLDREMVARELGFERVQNNVIYAADSRGKIESIILEVLDQITLTASRLAQDLVLFSLPEFGYFSLPRELCSGSSIMPQKKNPDALELVRAKSSTVSAACLQIKSILRSLPSGYNRDVQETKEPFFRGCDTAFQILKIIDLTVRNLEVNTEKLSGAFAPEIYATDAALELAGEGKSFREAYKQVGLNLEKLEQREPAASIGSRTSTGTAGNLNLNIPKAGLEKILGELKEKQRKTEKAIKKLFDFPVDLSPH